MKPDKLLLEQIAELPLTHQATIPEDYLDLMGHMNVMWYTHLFSNAMGGMFHLVGIDRPYMEKYRAGTFALEAHIRYLSEVRAEHSISVHSRFLGRSEKRIHVIHLMLNHSKKDLAATFEVVGAHIDMTIRRTSKFPDFIASQIDKLAEQHQRLEWEVPLCGSMRP